MSSSRRAQEIIAARKANRSLQASPYLKGKKHVKPPKSAEAKAAAGEIKKSSALSSLFSIFNIFKPKPSSPPKSLPQIVHQREQEKDGSESTPFQTEDEYEPDEQSDGDSQMLEETVPSLIDPRDEEPAEPPQIPFPTTNTPHKPGLFAFQPPQSTSAQSSAPPSRLQTPGFSRDPNRIRRSLAPVPPTPATGLVPSRPSARKTPGRGPPSRLPLSVSQLGPPAPLPATKEVSPIKSIEKFIESRSSTGRLSLIERQKVEEILHVSTGADTSHDDEGLPSAAYLGRGFVPSPSKSFLAPRPQQTSGAQSSLPQSDFNFHLPTSIQLHNPLASTSSRPAPTPKSARRRPIYIGPGMSLQSRPPRGNLLVRNTTQGSLSSLNGTGVSGLRSSSNVLQPAEEQNGKRTADNADVQSGKRRRTEGAEALEVTAPVPETSGPSASNAPTSVSSSKPTFKATSHIPRASTMRNPITAIASSNPAHPSPLRNMTKPNDSPSPPTMPRSRTSGAFMDILKAADKLNPPPSGKVDDFTNPYESKSRPVPVQIKSKKAPPKTKPAATDKKGQSGPKASAEQSKPTSILSNGRRSSLSSTAKPAPNAGHSSFLAPPRATRPTRNAPADSQFKYTVDDVDMEDDVEEISEIPPSRGPTLRKINGAKNREIVPITIEEISDDEDDAASHQNVNGGHARGANGVGRAKPSIKPSLVIEPDEPKRYGRSPSLGPRFHSPTIPSPLRVVSMPADEDSSSASPSVSGAENGGASREEMDVEIVELEERRDTVMHEVKAPSRPVSIEKRNTTAPAQNLSPEEEAKSVPFSALRKFTFVFSASPSSSMFVAASALSAEQREAKGTEIAKLPQFDFAPGALVTAAPVVQGFDFAAAGLAVKAPVGGTWSCSVCMCSSPLTAAKCTVCEADRPASVAAPAPAPAAAAPVNPAPIKAFDFAAAGLKMQASPADGSWKCATCDCSNPATATKTCTVCGIDK